MEREAPRLDLNEERDRFIPVADALHDILDGREFVRAGYGPTPLVELEAVMVAAGRVLISTMRLERLTLGGSKTRSSSAHRPAGPIRGLCSLAVSIERVNS